MINNLNFLTWLTKQNQLKDEAFFSFVNDIQLKVTTQLITKIDVLDKKIKRNLIISSLKSINFITVKYYNQQKYYK